MVQIPDDRRYFRIGEASRIVGVEPYVLRYWENEFPQLRPRRADSRQRTYQRKDLETLLEIKRLLYEERMTLEGAKLRLKKEPFFRRDKGRTAQDTGGAQVGALCRLPPKRVLRTCHLFILSRRTPEVLNTTTRLARSWRSSVV